MPPTLLSGRAPRSAEPRPAPTASRAAAPGRRAARRRGRARSTPAAAPAAGTPRWSSGAPGPGPAPSPAKTSRARPYQVVSPALVAWYAPYGALPVTSALDRAGHVHRPGGLAALVVHHLEGRPARRRGGPSSTRSSGHRCRTATRCAPPSCGGTGRSPPTRRPPWSARTPTAAPAAADSSYGLRASPANT